MMKLLDYIYFKYYQFLSNFDESMASFTAMMAICLWMFMVIVSLMAFLVYRSLLDPYFFFSNTILGIAVTSSLVILNYLYFLYKSRYKGIIIRFQEESNLRWSIGSILVVAITAIPYYTTFVFAVPFISNLAK